MQIHLKRTVCTVIDITKHRDGATTLCTAMSSVLLVCYRESNLFAIQVCAKSNATIIHGVINTFFCFL